MPRCDQGHAVTFVTLTRLGVLQKNKLWRVSVTTITKDSHYVVCSECFAVESSRIAAARRWLLIIDVRRRN